MRPAAQIFWQGFLTNVLNPKVALFFLAFLPQFINSGAESKALAFVFLGFVFDVAGTLWNLLVAVTAARVAGWVRESTQLWSWVHRAIGAVFVYLGFRLAFAEQR
jgi:threonine/homoserine/homoserine lactone efflux protein